MWNETCGKIFSQCIERFKQENIRYFIFRNYEELPEKNQSKDVDIVIEPQKIKKAMEIVKETYKDNGLKYYDEAIHDRLNCTHGIAEDLSFGTHMDLLAGYVVKGYEVYTFDEMYGHTIKYKDMVVLDEWFEALMLLISKIFGYKVFQFKQNYLDKVCSAYSNNKKVFREELNKLFTKKQTEKYLEDLEKHRIQNIAKDTKEFHRQLKKVAVRKAGTKTVGRKIRFIASRFSRIILHYKKNLRAIVLISDNEQIKEKVQKEIEKIINNIYVDEKCITLCADEQKRNVIEKITLSLFLRTGIHYDRVSLVDCGERNQFKGLIPEKMFIRVDEKTNSMSVAKAFCEQYMETL